tara:strand:+ start:112 stop:417 length:306 start_codon:yes stop_codon:yes gene_type:complete
MKNTTNLTNLIEQLSPESYNKLNAAIKAGANEAHFCFAGGSQFYRYSMDDINRGMNAHRTQKLSLRYVITDRFNNDRWEEVSKDYFWNSFVDDREMIYYSR